MVYHCIVPKRCLPNSHLLCDSSVPREGRRKKGTIAALSVWNFLIPLRAASLLLIQRTCFC